MIKIHDGGPAYPATIYYDEKPYGQHPGMSLRDWLAGQALAGMLAGEGDDFAYKTDTAAKRAYAMADAMIERRKK